MTPRTLVPCLALCAATLAAADSTGIPLVGAGDRPAAQPAAPRSGHSWELPAITVNAAGDGTARSDDLIGTYGQPRWSATRLFSEVRTYVIPEGQFDFEYWLKIAEPSKRDRDEAREAGLSKPKAEVQQVYEAEMGIGWRTQLDLYQVYAKDGSNGNNKLDATKFEIRHALADWDKIWGNPTLYAEWEQAAEGADSAEFKLLTCGNIKRDWVWANNIVWEGMTGNERDRSIEFNTAAGWTSADNRLSVGVETNLAQVSAREDSSDPGSRVHHYEVAAGPSARFHPIPPMHIIATVMVGLNEYAPGTKTTLIAGWEF